MRRFVIDVQNCFLRLPILVSYNATKELYYYGFKISLSIDYKGFPIAYKATSASVHDVNMAYDLVEQSLNKHTLADKGCVSEKLKQACRAIGVDLWMSLKKNQKSNESVDNSLLSKFRNKVETVIFILSLLGAQYFKNRSEDVGPQSFSPFLRF